jgi:hypothetical protein
MPMLTRSRGVRAVTAPAAVGLLAAASVIAIGAPQAAASTGTSLTVSYPVLGNTHLNKPNATVSLGPGTLQATLNFKSGALTASLTLPPATLSFQEFGLIPVSATTEFIPDGATTGKINIDTGAVTTTSKIVLKITSLTLAGLPIPVGNSCESAKPAVITVTSRPGFSVVSGGKLTGTYAVPPFAGCGLAGLLTPLINQSIAGPGNTITLVLGAAKKS